VLFATTEADDGEHAWAIEGDVLLPPLEPWTNRGEGQLRIWRQPWRWRDLPRTWIARGTGGPDYPFKDSPANPEILRSHRLAAFISGAAVSIYQSSAGAFGEDFQGSPAYARSGARSVLPSASQLGNYRYVVPRELPNGEVVANGDHFLSLAPAETILQSGKGALALLSRKLAWPGEGDTFYYLLVGQNADVHLQVHKGGSIVGFNPETWKELFQDTLYPGKPVQLTLPRREVPGGHLAGAVTTGSPLPEELTT
jgi:hypothetical protein